MLCCHDGKIVENQVNNTPELRGLLMENHPFSKKFLSKIYGATNSAFTFASLGVHVDMSSTRGKYCFRIHGTIYHKTCHLHPLAPGQEN